jgi:hypothetical protein
MVTADTSVEPRQTRLADPSRSLPRVERKMVRSTLSVSLREQGAEVKGCSTSVKKDFSEVLC